VLLLVLLLTDDWCAQLANVLEIDLQLVKVGSCVFIYPAILFTASPPYCD